MNKHLEQNNANSAHKILDYILKSRYNIYTLKELVKFSGRRVMKEYLICKIIDSSDRQYTRQDLEKFSNEKLEEILKYIGFDNTEGYFKFEPREVNPS